MEKVIKVALVGNPNVGKTSILNHLVGSNLKIGNWTGVTVEKKEGHTYFQDYKIVFVDLPGVYTLEDPISEDEKITVNFLSSENYDVILNVVESPRLDRDLYLTVQLFEFGKPLVLALNMIDEAEAMGIKIDHERLSQLLKVPVLKTIGRTGEGVKELLPAIVEVFEKKVKPVRFNYSEDIERLFISCDRENRFQKLREIIQTAPDLKNKIKEKWFSCSQGIAKEVCTQKLIHRKNITEVLDKFLLHPVLGNIFFVLIMYFLFKIAFDFSSPFIEWIDGFLSQFVSPLVLYLFNKIGAPEFLNSFFSSAVIGGVGLVLSFLPLIISMFFLLTLLETSGYLPRVAFLMDRFTHKLGLHGQSVIPLLLGFGCNVPAILATRTFQDTKDKFVVMSIIPFISCPARLLVFSFFASIFFKRPALIILALYLTGIVFGILTSLVLRKTLFKKELSHFVMDLPPYRVPSLSVLLNIVKMHTKEFICKAGTVIFLVSIGMWLLLNLPPSASKVEDTLAVKLGKAVSPIFRPIGLEDWRITTSILSGFLAREAILSNMGVVLNQNREKQEEPFHLLPELKTQTLNLFKAFEKAFFNIFSFLPASFHPDTEDFSLLKTRISNLFKPAQALSFLVFVLIYNSCLPTVVTMWRESSRNFALGFLIYSFILAWVLSFLVYRLLPL